MTAIGNNTSWYTKAINMIHDATDIIGRPICALTETLVPVTAQVPLQIREPVSKAYIAAPIISTLGLFLSGHEWALKAASSTYIWSINPEKVRALAAGEKSMQYDRLVALFALHTATGAYNFYSFANTGSSSHLLGLSLDAATIIHFVQLFTKSGFVRLRANV